MDLWKDSRSFSREDTVKAPARSQRLNAAPVCSQVHLGLLSPVLQVDEPVSDYAAMDDVYQVGTPEEGFKGTGLLGH
ncbi:uncharacterized protein isoform X2 [Takifugu rubripes]|uniref:uncharacterized protein isoform X2 n=1 Tax=Takifugu rubripes TaxID=31033 RepID=UPI001145E5B1|nr:uncharacterized protein LOC105419495 isoform X2 [Takifugu rubripes]XP_029682245.1 uncharacterized protein LOC105419495 isoform X2 [Takifugu rubripes]XP_029682248.1 uncharacterized protein LOC101073947 isoform X2 [Takifugu rubripes]XP_029682249.1 uncharacterized protein LOC101073947 isoform X2 [Takifugu rubripes]